MAEKTEADKLEEMVQKRLEEQREAGKMNLEILSRTYETRLQEMRESFEERKKEFLAQNDGLLGAVGRLYAETEDLRKRIALTKEAAADEIGSLREKLAECQAQKNR